MSEIAENQHTATQPTEVEYDPFQDPNIHEWLKKASHGDREILGVYLEIETLSSELGDPKIKRHPDEIKAEIRQKSDKIHELKTAKGITQDYSF